MKTTNAVLIILAAVLFVNISMTVRQGSQIDLVKARTEGIWDWQAKHEELIKITPKKLIHRDPPKTDFEAERIYQEQYQGELTGESIYQIYQMRRSQNWSVVDAWHYAHLALPVSNLEAQAFLDGDRERLVRKYKPTEDPTP